MEIGDTTHASTSLVLAHELPPPPSGIGGRGTSPPLVVGVDLIAAMMLLLARVVDLWEGGDAHPALRSPYSVSAQAALSAPRP